AGGAGARHLREGIPPGRAGREGPARVVGHGGGPGRAGVVMGGARADVGGRALRGARLSLPAWARHLVRILAPPEFSPDLLDDLEEGWAERRGGRGGARRWLAGELARTPWLEMRR